MNSGIYLFVLRDAPANDVTPKLLGAPRAGKRSELESRFERERVFYDLARAVEVLAADVRRLIPALTVRVSPLPRCDGVKLVCELYSGSYSVCNEATFSAAEMRDLPFMRARVSRMIATVLNTIASQVEYAALR